MIDNLVNVIKYKKFIIISTLIVFIISIGISFSLTVWYKSTALIMPPETDKIGFNLNIPLNLPFAGGLGGDNTFFKFMSILKSRTIKEKLINEFDLKREYDQEYLFKTIKVLENNTDINVTEEGAISLSMYDQDPYKARDMTIRYFQLLDSIYTNLSIERAENNRMFLESRVTDTHSKLAKAEDDLKGLQQETGILVIPEQISEGIKLVTQIEAKVIELNNQLNYLKKVIDVNSPQYIRVKYELAEYQKTLNELTNGKNGEQLLQTLPPLSDIPDITLQYYRYFRDIQIHTKILEFIYPQYEKARLEEAKDIPNLQLLDYPQVPEWKSKPKRVYIVIAITFLYLVLLFGYLLTHQKLILLAETNPDKYQKLQLILKNVNPFKLNPR